MADKEVTVQLTVKAAAEQARREMQGLARDTEQTRKAMKEMEADRKRAQSGAGAMAGMPGRGLAGMGLGFFGVQGAASLMGTAANIGRVMSDPYATREESRGAVGGVPVVGGLIKNFLELSDVLTGFTARMKEYGRELQMSQARIAAQHAAAVEVTQYGITSAGLRGRAGAAMGAAFPGRVAVDRSTVGSEMVGEYQLSRQAGLLQQRRAGIEITGKEEELKRIRDELIGTRREASNAEKAMAEAQLRYKFILKPGTSTKGLEDVKGFEDPRWREMKDRIEKEEEKQPKMTGAERRAIAVKDEAKAFDELTRARERIHGMERQRLQTMNELEQARSNQQRAGIELEKQRLNLLTQQADRVRGQVGAFGAMTGVEKEALTMALERRKKEGVGALSLDERALIQRGGFGDVLAKDIENLTVNDPRFRRAKELVGEGGEADLRRLQRERDELRQKIPERLEQVIDQETTAMANNFGKSIQRLVQSLEKKIDAEVHRIDLELRRRQLGV